MSHDIWGPDTAEELKAQADFTTLKNQTRARIRLLARMPISSFSAHEFAVISHKEPLQEFDYKYYAQAIDSVFRRHIG